MYPPYGYYSSTLTEDIENARKRDIPPSFEEKGATELFDCKGTNEYGKLVP